MKKLLVLIFAISFLASCNKEVTDVEQKSQEPITFEQFQSDVTETLKNDEVYDWRTKSDLHIFSAGELSDQFYNIGYTINQDFDMKSNIHKINLQSSEWQRAKQEVFNILQAEIEKGKDINSLLPFGDEATLPHLSVQIKSLSTIEALRRSPYVRFVEPTGFSITDLQPSVRQLGCSAEPNYNITSDDYTNIAPGIKRSWHLPKSGVPQAWSQSTGDGVKICIIDTGVSDDQENMGSAINDGYSSGRNVFKYSTHVTGSWWWASLDSPNDQCGHGTRMAGLAGAPRGTDGNSVGVAYNADMMTVRAVADVFISSSQEKNGVRDALILAANTGAKVASMSLGTPFYSSTVADGVYYAYNYDVMINVAAGTSLTWLSWYGVLFPATMNETIAVTGLKDNAGYVKCATCHDGSKVDFALIMERDNGDNNRTALSLSMDTDQPGYVGGSSCATATFSGMSALVRSKYPNENRSQILERIKQASDFYPGRDANYGWGKVNVNDALNGGN